MHIPFTVDRALFKPVITFISTKFSDLFLNPNVRIINQIVSQLSPGSEVHVTIIGQQLHIKTLIPS
jgi:hypothetical protein